MTIALKQESIQLNKETEKTGTFMSREFIFAFLFSDIIPNYS